MGNRWDYLDSNLHALCVKDLYLPLYDRHSLTEPVLEILCQLSQLNVEVISDVFSLHVYR